MDIYRKYDFRYNEKVYMENFKNAISRKVYSLSDFHAILCSIRITSYDTARSYYNMRRVIPFEVFAILCDKLDLNATKILFPNSILDSNCDKKIGGDYNCFMQTYNLFIDIFTLNPEQDYLSPEFYNMLKESISRLSLVLARYNYLIQKYNFADLCNSELLEVVDFTKAFIIKRSNNEYQDWHEFRTWVQNLKSNDFLKDFYDEYSLAFHGTKCSTLLDSLKDKIPTDLVEEINCLLPNNERIIVNK